MKTFPCFQCFSAFYIHIQKLGGNTSPQPFLISPNGRACRATAYRHWRATRYNFRFHFTLLFLVLYYSFAKGTFSNQTRMSFLFPNFFLIVHFQESFFDCALSIVFDLLLFPKARLCSAEESPFGDEVCSTFDSLSAY